MGTARKSEKSTARRVIDTALDVAIGGTALAADKALDAIHRIRSRGAQAARTAREKTQSAAEEVRTATGTDQRPYEERTRDELYELAAERRIEGRSSMQKDELIFALRATR